MCSVRVKSARKLGELGCTAHIPFYALVLDGDPAVRLVGYTAMLGLGPPSADNVIAALTNPAASVVLRDLIAPQRLADLAAKGDPPDPIPFDGFIGGPNHSFVEMAVRQAVSRIGETAGRLAAATLLNLAEIEDQAVLSTGRATSGLPAIVVSLEPVRRAARMQLLRRALRQPDGFGSMLINHIPSAFGLQPKKSSRNN